MILILRAEGGHTTRLVYRACFINGYIGDEAWSAPLSRKVCVHLNAVISSVFTYKPLHTNQPTEKAIL